MALGFPHPRYLLPLLSARDMAEWEAYADIEPFGEERADLRMGILAATMVNLWSGKDSRSAKPADFMPIFYEPHGRRPVDNGRGLHEKIISTFLGMGAVDLRKNK